MGARQSLEQGLRAAGYRDRRDGVFEAPYSRRIIALFDATSTTHDWNAFVDRAVRQELFRAAPNWCRYAVLILNCPKTAELAAAAAAFCRDVSKCRRLVAFSNQSGPEVLPFLALSETTGGRGTPGRDLDEIARRLLSAPELASAFLDEQTSTSQVRALAEEIEISHD